MKMSSPTLKTIRMVEKALKHSDYSLVKLSELKRSLPKQVNHNTLIQVIDYLQESGKVLVSMKGVFWLHKPSENLREILESSRKHSDILLDLHTANN
jgi:hypothetical protein